MTVSDWIQTNIRTNGRGNFIGGNRSRCDVVVLGYGAAADPKLSFA